MPIASTHHTKRNELAIFLCSLACTDFCKGSQKYQEIIGHFIVASRNQIELNHNLQLDEKHFEYLSNSTTQTQQ